MIAELTDTVRRAYRMDHWRERRRAVIFMMRGVLHWHTLRTLYRYFAGNEILRALYAHNPFPVEQATRAFFYAGSTLASRIALIRAHYDTMMDLLPAQDAVRLSLDGEYEIWRAADTDMVWRSYLHFDPGQRKEGLLSVMMDVDNVHLYQMIFWFDRRNEERVLIIGAMQGPNTEDAQDFVREMTKRAHRFRTKNLILYMVQAVARALGMKRIFAVSNAGYYANNHVRVNRKLKTDFGAFWEEAGGRETEDKRFYELPLVLPRKTMEEVPTRKRAVYRRRFAFLDAVDAEIEERVKALLK